MKRRCCIAKPFQTACLFYRNLLRNQSLRGNILAQKRACCVENVRKVFNLVALSVLQARLYPQNLTLG